jgi:ferrous iron transport protein A
MDLTQLEAGTTACIVDIYGGYAVRHKLELIGILPGKTVKKVSQALMRGPVVIALGTMQLALGRGMAQKILVKQVDTEAV